MFKNTQNTINLDELYNNNSFELKNDYYLTIVFNKNNYSFKNLLYKILFKSKFTHISIFLDNKYEIETTFENGTIYKDVDIKNDLQLIEFNKYMSYRLNKIVKIKISKEEYYRILNLKKIINNTKYDNLSLFKNLFNNSLYNKNKFICTEILELVLLNINIKVNNRYNIVNLYNNLIKKLEKSDKQFYLI